MNKCGDCGKALRPLQKTCACGWAGTAPEPSKADMRHSHFQCHYETGGERCPAHGTRNTSVGKGERRWLCTPHYNARHDPKGSQLILQDYRINGVPIQRPWVEAELELLKKAREVNLAQAMKKIAERQVNKK